MNEPTMFASDSLRRVALVMLLVSVMLPATLTMATAGNLNVRRRVLSQGTVVWSSGFETGDFSEWTDNYDYRTGAVGIVTSSFQHSGTYSNYAYYVGPPGGDNRRAYPSYYPPTYRPAHFLIELWVYVPSVVNGETVKLTDWSSFISIWVSKGFWQEAYPITVDSVWWANGRNQELMMNLHMLPNGVLLQTNPIKWPFDKWFKIGLEVDLHPGTANTRVTVYQDNIAIINWVGDLGNTSVGYSGTVTYDGLSDSHFGFYAGNKQGTLAFYNDDIVIYAFT